jgi:hypothetical protein
MKRIRMMLYNIIKNSYKAGSTYRIVVQSRKAFSEMEFEFHEDKIGKFENEVFIDLNDIYLGDGAEEISVSAVKDTKLSRKVFANSVLNEVGDYIIIEDSHNWGIK